MTLPTPQYIFETIWQGFFDKETTNSDMFTREDTVFLLSSVAVLRGAWVGHCPPDFWLALCLLPPVFCLISRSSSFD